MNMTMTFKGIQCDMLWSSQ